jgi:hypothetical protein
MLSLSNRLKLANPIMGGFVGALDAYTTNLVALYSPFKRLLASYTGNGIRVRRSSDSTLQWIGFNADGSFDETSYLAFIGAGNGFAHTVADQSGNGRDQTQATAAAQPQIGVDGNGNYYLYAPGAGFTTTRMQCTGLSLACTDFTFWAVASGASYACSPISTRDNVAVKERVVINYSGSIGPIFQDSATGTVASIGSLGTNPYSTVWSAGSGGNKLSNRLTTATGTRTPVACTINELNLGATAGGAFWSQNSRIYLGALWSEDKGPTADFAALATLGKTLIPAAQ